MIAGPSRWWLEGLQNKCLKPYFGGSKSSELLIAHAIVRLHAAACVENHNLDSEAIIRALVTDSYMLWNRILMNVLASLISSTHCYYPCFLLLCLLTRKLRRWKVMRKNSKVD